MLFAIGLLTPTSARAQIDDAQYRADLSALGSLPTRAVGTDGYYKAADYLEQQIKALGPNVELQRHEFPALVPVTKSATLSIGGRDERVYPFWPAVVRVNATPAEGLGGNAVYVGEGAFETVKPASVYEQIAVVEGNASRGGWQQVAAFGPKAILILGSDDQTNTALRTHDLTIPLNIPRFYVPSGPLADSLRKGVDGPVTLRASVNWERRTLRNYYAFVKPARPAPDGWTQSSPPAALMFSVPFEAGGLVPDLASGAGQAINTAAGLALLRDVAKSPLDRPVVVYFSGGDSLQYQASRNMLMALADPPVIWRTALDELRVKQQAVERDLGRLRALLAKPDQIDVVEDASAIDRVKKLIETDSTLEQDRLFRLRILPKEARTSGQEAELTELEQNQITLSNLRFAVERRPEELREPDKNELARRYIRRAIVRLGGEPQAQAGLVQQYAERQGELTRRIELYEWLAGALGRNKNPGDKTNNSRLIELLVGLDLSDQGVRVGPMFWGTYFRQNVISVIQDYGEWMTRQLRAAQDGKEQVAWLDDNAKRVLDLEPLGNARSPQSWLTADLPLPSEIGQAWGVPAFSMVTLDDLRLRRDTPADDLSKLSPEAIDRNILPQVRAVRSLFRSAWNDARFRGPVEVKWDRTQFTGQVVSPAPGRPVPDLPREGFVAAAYFVNDNLRPVPGVRWLPYTMGVRKNQVVETDAEGSYRYEGLPKIGPGDDMTRYAALVYQMTPDTGAITATTDLVKSAEEKKWWYADLKTNVTPIRSPVFNAAEFSLIGLYDPRFLQGLGEVQLLDARRNASPQRYGMMIHREAMAGFIEPDMLSLLIFRYGRVGNRLLLLNVDPQRAGKGPSEGARGFTLGQLNDLGPLSVQTTEDFHTLDEVRLNDYRRAGVQSALVDGLHKAAGEQLVDAKEALRADDGQEMVRNANGAWSDEARVYQAAQDMARDVVRAAIFLLLLCVPFSFCMERLLIGTPNIYKQIAYGCLIFAIMTAALWSFHPAFKISSSPLIIILAFAIIFMSIVVISVVYGKFDTELKRIRSGRGTTEGASFARTSVLMSAVLLGIANMRKRKFRTALTAITIVLITFAVLCFTSASVYVGTTALPTGVDSSHPGIMLRQRGWRPMPGPVLENLAAVLGKDSVGRIAQRYWNVSAGDSNNMLHVVAPGDGRQPPTVFPAQAALGLTGAEADVSPELVNVLGKDNFARLARGERVIFLSNTIAQQLGVVQNQVVKLGGIDLQVAFVFSADDFDQRVLTLSGEPLAPLKYSSGALDAGGRRLDDQSSVESLDLDPDAAASELSAGNYEHLSSTRFVIIPAEISRLLPSSSLRSLAFREPNFEKVKPTADELARRFAVAMFAGFEDGVKMVSAGNLSSVKGGAAVAVPLAIAGLIVFNTMMGSIAERRKEIHVYTSLGLAPLHVGALFVAEAMTYGLIGTVFGYVIGQGVGTLLLKLGWLGGVTLNYSGTSAMLTMGLILIIVLLSALVPARLASKIAAPSIDRSWKVPLPRGDEIVATLPFTINKTAADGALAYLAEFFEAHQEGSIGKFSAGKVEAFTIEDDKPGLTPGDSRGLKTVIWLTPFDLGVRQHLMLLIHPGQYPEIYEVQVVLQRLSGDDGSWYRMNRTFLTELRKQFLAWRSLSPQRMLDYVEESKSLFAQVPARVVTTAPGEQVRLA